MTLPTDLLVRLRAAVELGQAARKRYFEVIGLPDEQVIGPPATEEQVAALEARVKRSLPPSYRAFLLHFGSWRMVDGGVDLLSVEDMLAGPVHERVTHWQVKEAGAGNRIVGRSLVIGISSVTATKYLLDPGSAQSGNEWSLLQYHHGVEAEVESFLLWLEQSVNEYNELADDPS